MIIYFSSLAGFVELIIELLNKFRKNHKVEERDTAKLTQIS